MALRIVMAGIALAALAGGASAAVGDWGPAATPDRAFEVQTPCDSADLAKFSATPRTAFPGAAEPSARVVCFKYNFLFYAGATEEPAMPGGSAPLFDMIVDKMNSAKDIKGAPRAMTIDGHRAMVNRELSGDVLAQAGVIEISRNKVVFLISGSQGGGLSVEDQGKLIDRFYASFKVTAE